VPSWSAAVAYTEAQPVPPRRRPRGVASRRRDPLRNGVVWIVVIGTLLAGLVAVNVAVLQLNVRLDRLAHERAVLREENAALESQSSSAQVLALIQARARERLGLVPATARTYVDIRKR
jgi:hypothetical protein